MYDLNSTECFHLQHLGLIRLFRVPLGRVKKILGTNNWEVFRGGGGVGLRISYVDGGPKNLKLSLISKILSRLSRISETSGSEIMVGGGLVLDF